MLIVRLTRDIDGLGQAGSLVVADKSKVPADGEWMVVERADGACCVRWEAGLPRGAKVIYPLP